MSSTNSISSNDCVQTTTFDSKQNIEDLMDELICLNLEDQYLLQSFQQLTITIN